MQPPVLAFQGTTEPLSVALSTHLARGGTSGAQECIFPGVLRCARSEPVGGVSHGIMLGANCSCDFGRQQRKS